MKRVFLAAVLLTTSGAYAGSTFKVLHSFHCDPSGCGPTGGLVFDDAGNLYGTTGGGGDADATIFRLSPSDGRWTYSLLYTLTISQGSAVEPSLTLDSAGNLYGTSINGGAHDVGSVFELSPDPSATGGWTLQVLHSFLNSHADGQYPWDKVILDKAGNVYGTTTSGGGAEGAAGGVVFELTPAGDWTESSHPFAQDAKEWGTLNRIFSHRSGFALRSTSADARAFTLMGTLLFP